MFEEIRISSLGVIESSTLELGPGLTVITGETGAGKTMVVTALSLLLGGRADTGAVRSGSAHARVEGVVDARTLTAFCAAVDEVGGDTEDGQVVIARNIAAEGRSRAWVGGASVPVSRMAEVTESLVAVHGQSDQHRLLRAGAQRDALDRHAAAAVDALLAEWRRLHTELTDVERELDDVVTHARERAQEADRLRFGLGEVEAVSPEPGEDTALAAEESRLGYADTLRTAAEQAREALSSDDDAPDALATTAAARTLLEGVRDHDPEAGELADRLAELTYLLSDLAADVASYASRLDIDPARLAAVSERRASITALTRKYGETVEDVLAWAQESSRRLLDLDDTDGRTDALRAEQSRLRTELADTGARLSAARQSAAAELGDQVSGELTQLAMPHAVVTIAVGQHEVAEPERPTPGVLRVGKRWLRATTSGLDEVEFLLAANTGSEARPLHKGASGGELSRVMLALEVSLAESNPVPTFVFDEVDAGVGGKAAIEIGRRLAQLARRAQVLVVTHLPQVAAFADRHVVVHKQSDGTVTTSGLVVLDDEAREKELSRMLAGVEESDSARAHARELLDTAAPSRAGS